MRRRVGLAILAVVAQACWLQTGFDESRAGFNGSEDTVTAANVADLEVAWTASVGGVPGEAIADAGTTYVRTPGALTALATATGEQRWAATSLGGSSVAALADGTLWVTTTGAACRLVSVDPATGATLATRTIGGPDLTGFPRGSRRAAPATSWRWAPRS